MNQKNLNSAISIRRLQDIWYIISLSILIEDSLQVFICLHIRVNYKLNYLELEWERKKTIENFQQYEENDEDDENFRMSHSYWFKGLLTLSFNLTFAKYIIHYFIVNSHQRLSASLYMSCNKFCVIDEEQNSATLRELSWMKELSR